MQASFNLSRMLLLGSYVQHGSPTTSHRCFVTFIGNECHSGSSSNEFAVLVYRCLRGMAAPYLARKLCRVADMDCRRRLRSASTLELHVPPTRRITVGDRAFAVSAARVWNDLPSDVITSPSLISFKRRLKTPLFSRSFDL